MVIDETAVSIWPDCTAGEQAVERNVDDRHVHAEPLADLVDEVDLEADEVAVGVLELPGHVADIGAELDLGGLRPERRREPEGERQAEAERAAFGDPCR